MDSTSVQKAIGALLVLTIGGSILFFKPDVPPNYLSLLQVVYATFVAGHAVEHYTTMNSKQGS